MSEEEIHLHLDRREALKTIAVGVGAATSLPLLQGKAQAATTTPPEASKFFDAHQRETVDVLSELIIPTDAHSPGAKAAQVVDYVDLVVGESPEEERKLWTEGLAELDKTSTDWFGKPFVEIKNDQQTALLLFISQNEKDPRTLMEKFFRQIKNKTVDGYYTSEIGIHKELQYKGNTYLKEFVGCTHPEHQG